MSSFKNIKDYYNYIEDNSIFSSSTIMELNSALIALYESKDNELEDKVEWERIILNSFIIRGELKPFWETIDKNGEIISYPNLNLLSTEAFTYLDERSDEVKNPQLIVKYNHILWLSKPNNKYARKALKAYLVLIKDSHEDKTNILVNALTLSSKSNICKEEIKQIFRAAIIEDKNLKAHELTYLISYALGIKKLKKTFFEGFIERLETINQQLHASGEFMEIIENLKVAKRLSNKLQLPTKQITYNLGKYNALAADHQTTKGLAQLLYYAKSLEYFSQSKAPEESKQVEDKFNAIKKRIDIPVHSFEFDISRTVMFYERLKERMLQMSSTAIFNDLSRHNSLIFPCFKTLNAECKNGSTFFTDFFTGVFFDKSSNISLADNSEEAVQKRKLYNSYKMDIGLKLQVFLFPLFLEGSKRNLITYNSMMEYLSNTWLKDKFIQNRSGAQVEYSWLQLLAPGIYETFSQLEIYSNIGKCNVTLAIDSLTLKFEGMFLEFSTALGIKTIQPNNKSKDIRIQNVYIDQLLSNPELMKLFDENDRMLFTFILSKNGIDLRNDIAHSFLRPQDYTINKAILLLLAILRIGKYQLVDPS